MGVTRRRSQPTSRRDTHTQTFSALHTGTQTVACCAHVEPQDELQPVAAIIGPYSYQRRFLRELMFSYSAIGQISSGNQRMVLLTPQKTQLLYAVYLNANMLKCLLAR